MNLHPLLVAGLVGGMSLLTSCAKSDAPATVITGRNAASVASEATLEAGKAIYGRICIVCHQPNGLGVPGVFPPLAGSSIANEADAAKIIRIVLDGLQGPVEVGGKRFNSAMPAQGGVLSNHEIGQVLTYVRSTWGNAAPAVSEDAVATVRETVKHPAPWTWEELNAK